MPSVALQEIDKSEIIPNLASSVMGCAGDADRGPIERTLVQNNQDFENRYGLDNPNKFHYSILKLLEQTQSVYANRAKRTGALYGGASVYNGGHATQVGTVQETFDIVVSTNDNIKIDVDDLGVQEITLTPGVSLTAVTLAADIQTLLDSAFGAGKVTSIAQNGKVVIFSDSTGNSSSIEFYTPTNDAHVTIGIPTSGRITGVQAYILTAAGSGYPLTVVAASNDKIKIDVNNAGVQTLTVPPGVFTRDALVTQIQALLDAAFGTGIITVAGSSTDKMTFSTVLLGGTSEIDIQTVANDIYADIGITNDPMVTQGSTGVNLAYSVGEADPSAHSFAADELFIVTGADPTTWYDLNNAFTIENWDATENTFDFVEWLKNAAGAYVEQNRWTVSRDTAKKDGYGRNIYFVTFIEQRSVRYKVVDNTTLAKTLPVSVMTTPLATVGGVIGTAATASQVATAFNDAYGNKDDVSINYIINCGYTDDAVRKKIIDIAEDRQDCLPLLDVIFDSSASASVTDRQSQSSGDSNRAAIYCPWQKDSFAELDQQVWTPASAHAGARAAYKNRVAHPWYAFAGKKRGQTNSVDVRTVFTALEIKTLENAQVNVIRKIPGQGIYVWGNLTMQSSKKSALSSVNVRELLIYISKAALIYLEGQLFEFNDEITRGQVSENIDAFVAQIAANRGVYDYRIVCDTTNNTPTVIDEEKLYCDIYLKPARAVKDIILRVVVTKTGASFEELISGGLTV